MHWIPIAEQYPKEGNVLVYANDKWEGEIIMAAEWWRGEWHPIMISGYEWDWDFNLGSISHWMPLPDPPAEEG